jgi:hypothetical protein
LIVIAGGNWSGLVSIRRLELNGNMLTGSVPSLTGMASVNYIDLSENMFSGTFPDVSTLYMLG